jgi:hypothetical protein
LARADNHDGQRAGVGAKEPADLRKGTLLQGERPVERHIAEPRVGYLVGTNRFGRVIVPIVYRNLRTRAVRRPGPIVRVSESLTDLRVDEITDRFLAREAGLKSSGVIFRYALRIGLIDRLLGLTFAPLGALLPELFPTEVAYTGASTAYSLGGILGASLAPYLAQLLLERGGLPWVGYYLVLAAAISFLSVLSMNETARD